MKAEPFESWARRKAKDLAAVDPVKEVVSSTPLLSAELAAQAPKRSGRLARSFSASLNQVKSTSPYVFKVDRGGIIVARNRALVIPLTPGYRIGAGGFVTVGPEGNRAVVRAGSSEFVAIRTRSVYVRARPYLAKARESWARKLTGKLSARLDKAAR